MQQKTEVIIIGAGASGLMAALSAAENGAGVLVLEHMPSAGQKLLLTGNGRCNFTNSDVSVRHYHSLSSSESSGAKDREKTDAFLSEVLRQFSFSDCIQSFRSLGIEEEIRHYRFDDTGYVYPAKGGAELVLKALLKKADELGVKFIFQAKLSSITPSGNGYILGWHVPSAGHTVFQEQYADTVILAAGSNACPKTGSDSSIYPFLKSLGLSDAFTGFYPALCALYSKDPLLSDWKGRRAEGEASLSVSEMPVRTESGEIQFNEHSISGIPVMQLSRYAAAALKEEKPVSLTVRIPDPSGGDPLMDHSFAIHRTGGFDRAQCCTGGIRPDTVDAKTMESKICPKIYICGELLDIDGDCGGYNLHFAWATGSIAGKNAAL